MVIEGTPDAKKIPPLFAHARARDVHRSQWGPFIQYISAIKLSSLRPPVFTILARSSVRVQSCSPFSSCRTILILSHYYLIQPLIVGIEDVGSRSGDTQQGKDSCALSFGINLSLQCCVPLHLAPADLFSYGSFIKSKRKQGEGTTDVVTAALPHHNGYRRTPSIYLRDKNILNSTGLPKIFHLHLPLLRRHTPRPRRAHLLRPLHLHGRLQTERDPPHATWW